MTRLPVHQPRSCGDCVACCVALPIDELSKPAGVPCVHLAERGCGIYATRPAPCRGFACSWLQGHLSGAQRPDRLGAMVYASREPLNGALRDMVHIVELEPNAMMKAEVRLIAREAEKAKFVVIAHDYIEPRRTA